MFCGKTYNVLDNKNRLMVPQQFRDELGANVYVTVGYDRNLFLMTAERFNIIAEKLNAMSETREDTRLFKRFFFGNATPCELDKQGRILLPQTLLDEAGIKKEIVIIGISDKLEIWDREIYTNAPNGDSTLSKKEMLAQLSEHGF